MPKGVAQKEFRFWTDDEKAKLLEFAKTPAKYKPTYIGFWEKFPLVTGGARTAMSCRNRYMFMCKTESIYQDAKTKSAPASLAQSTTKASMSNAGGPSKLMKKDSELCIFRNNSTSEPTATAEMEVIDLCADDDDENIVALNREPIVKKVLKSVSYSASLQLEASSISSIASKQFKLSSEHDTTTPVVKSTATSKLSLNLECCKKYLEMYRTVRSHIGSDIEDIRLIATHIDKVVRIVYGDLGLDLHNTSIATDEMVENLLTPHNFTGSDANLRKLLIFNIFASYSNVALVEKFGSNGFKYQQVSSSTKDVAALVECETNMRAENFVPMQTMEIDSSMLASDDYSVNTDLLPSNVAEDSEMNPVAESVNEDKVVIVDFKVRVGVYDFNKALPIIRNCSTIEDRILCALNKAAELLYSLNGKFVSVAGLVHLRVISKSCGKWVKVDASQLKKKIQTLRDIRIDFGDCLNALISHGDVVIVYDVCNLAKSSGNVILFNPAWALTELILLKMEMNDLAGARNAGLCITMENKPDTFLVKYDVPWDYITSTILLQYNNYDGDVQHLVANPRLKNKVLLIFENKMEEDVTVSSLKNPNCDDDDEEDYGFQNIQPTFKSEDSFQIKPKEIHNCYFEFNKEDFKKWNRLLLLFAAKTINKSFRVCVELRKATVE